MTIIIIIIIIITLYFLFKNINTRRNSIYTDRNSEDYNAKIKKIAEYKSYIDKNKLYNDKKELSSDENGQYELVKRTRKIPRKTYIKALFNGKYWGEIDEHFSDQFEQSKYFDFNIYEVSLKDAIYASEPFQLEQDLRIPREKLPRFLHTILEKDGKEYEVNLHEPIFANIKSNRKLHQDEGNEVFGTIDAVVTGYILDFIKEVYFEKKYITSIDEIIPVPIPQIEESIPIKTNVPTGNVEYNANYKRIEYFYSDYEKTYWSDWKYTKPPTTTNNEGCFSSVIGVLAGIIGITFLLMMLPQMTILIPFFLILFILKLIPARFFSWLFRIIGILLLVAYIIGLFYIFRSTSYRYIPEPVVTEKPEERVTRTEPIVDTLDGKIVNDELIKHFRIWKDYDGNQYEGTIWTKKSDFTKAKYFKNNLILNSNSPRVYDEMIYRLKENDKNHLGGVYQLFDSIRQKEQLSNLKFAELIVSFVQDIPYTVIVPDDCNPNLYEDKFIKKYLSSADARCDGFEKFGINSPIEFMSTLNGDCDTRTLLLYTILANYGYDVALFSSEYYAHSIIGINLPISGIAYQHQNQRYVLWETTAPNIKAGVLPKEISNLNYWRISLKSK